MTSTSSTRKKSDPDTEHHYMGQMLESAPSAEDIHHDVQMISVTPLRPNENQKARGRSSSNNEEKIFAKLLIDH